jgi:hypothetical protein
MNFLGKKKWPLMLCNWAQRCKTARLIKVKRKNLNSTEKTPCHDIQLFIFEPKLAYGVWSYLGFSSDFLVSWA